MGRDIEISGCRGSPAGASLTGVSRVRGTCCSVIGSCWRPHRDRGRESLPSQDGDNATTPIIADTPPDRQTPRIGWGC